jgi:hypothetical protein
MKGYPTKIMREGRELALMTESAQLKRVGTLTESKDDKSDAHWECDIWKLGEENLNGRVYTKDLGTRLEKEQPVTIVNDGHYADWCNGNEYLNAKAVAKNVRVDGDMLKCDLEFLAVESEYEKRLEELAAKGVAIGVSSVGYGEYMPDGKTINWETYEVVRLVDFVTMPAGEVYAHPVGTAEPEEPETTEDDNNDDSDEKNDDEEMSSSKCGETKSESFERAVSEIMNRRYRK